MAKTVKHETASDTNDLVNSIYLPNRDAKIA